MFGTKTCIPIFDRVQNTCYMTFFLCFVEGTYSNFDTRCAKWQVCSFSVGYADSFAKKKDREAHIMIVST